MGRSHSKSEKLKATTVDNMKSAPLSPRQKRDKFKKEVEKKKQKKFGFVKKKSKLEDLKVPRSQILPDPNEMFSDDDLEVEIKRRMQDQLAFNSDIFVLNQMMMSVQFFANYERFEGLPLNTLLDHELKSKTGHYFSLINQGEL